MNFRVKITVLNFCCMRQKLAKSNSVLKEAAFEKQIQFGSALQQQVNKPLVVLIERLVISQSLMKQRSHSNLEFARWENDDREFHHLLRSLKEREKKQAKLAVIFDVSTCRWC